MRTGSCVANDSARNTSKSGCVDGDSHRIAGHRAGVRGGHPRRGAFYEALLAAKGVLLNRDSKSSRHQTRVTSGASAGHRQETRFAASLRVALGVALEYRH